MRPVVFAVRLAVGIIPSVNAPNPTHSAVSSGAIAALAELLASIHRTSVPREEVMATERFRAIRVCGIRKTDEIQT